MVEAVGSGVLLISTMGVAVCTVGHALALAVREGAAVGKGRRVGGGAGVSEAVSVTGRGEGNTLAMGVGREQATNAASIPNTNPTRSKRSEHWPAWQAAVEERDSDSGFASFDGAAVRLRSGCFRKTLSMNLPHHWAYPHQKLSLTPRQNATGVPSGAHSPTVV
jgi:hypothetical protein